MSRHTYATGLALSAGLILAAVVAQPGVAATAAAPAAKAAPAAAAAAAKPAAAPVHRGPSCNRACLEGFVDRYMAAMIAHDIHALPWGDHVRFTENGVPLLIGDGLWGSISGKGPAAYDLKLADPATGEVGYYGIVMEHETVPGYLALRMKVEGGKITEVETIVNRQPGARGGGPRPASTAGADPMTATHFPDMSEPVKASERTPRAAMIKAADGYFATLQRNNGKLFVDFTKECGRKENGFLSTTNGETCGSQFKLGRYRYDSEVRRQVLLADEEHGVVMARMFIDHDGSVIDYKLSDGTDAHSTYHSPQTLTGLEIFKIKNGKIDKAEVVFLEVPYHMPSVWVNPDPNDAN